MSFIPVTHINVMTTVPLPPMSGSIYGNEVEIIAEVEPSDATNKTIEWSVVSAENPGPSIRKDGTRYFIRRSFGSFTLRAIIRNGKQQ